MCEGLSFWGSWESGRRAIEPLVLALSVERPVGVPVVGETNGAEVKDSVSPVLGPAHAGLFHAVFDEVTTGTLDHTGANRPAPRQVLVVAHVGRVAPIVPNRGGDGLLLGRREHRLVRCGGQGGDHLI